MSEIKERAAVLAGAALLACVGKPKFYIYAQRRRGFFGRIASAFCQGHAGRVGANYSIFMNDKDKERMTDIAMQYYSDDSLHGFADDDYSKRADGKPLLEQQRGLILPLVVTAIDKDSPETVLEIGCGNGDAIAYLAKAYPNVKFIGVDLSVKVAEKKHSLPNLSFIKGYALDLMREGLNADLIYGSSTFCIFAPKELGHYMVALESAKRVIISEPVMPGFKHLPELQEESLHMDLYMWWHNYFGYLTYSGWTVETAETVNFAYRHNPNAKVFLINARH